MFEKELEASIHIAREAMKNIMNYYTHGFHTEIKKDNSPVTEADKTTDKLIRDYLSKLFPKYAFLTEESEDNLERLNNDYVFIIDPLDGTEDYVHKDDEFTCNIGLSYKHVAVMGVVAIPAKNLIYYAVKGEGAYKIDEKGNITRIHVSNKKDDLTCLTSVFHLAPREVELIDKYKDKITSVIKRGSSIKACDIAEGKAEISYRLSDGTKEWDTCAFQIIVEEAGGYVVKLNGEPIKYNREDVYNRGGYLILNSLDNMLL